MGLSLEVVDDDGGLHPHGGVGLRLLEVDEDREALAGEEVIVDESRVLPRVFSSHYDVLPGAASVGLDQSEAVLGEGEPQGVGLEGDECREEEEE